MNNEIKHMDNISVFAQLCTLEYKFYQFLMYLFYEHIHMAFQIATSDVILVFWCDILEVKACIQFTEQMKVLICPWFFTM